MNLRCIRSTIVLGVVTSLVGAGRLAAQSTQPAGPREAPSVTQYGITWTFENPARVGQFVNGDWYVVGAVTVVGMGPKPVYEPNAVRNGSMLNPPAYGGGEVYPGGMAPPSS